MQATNLINDEVRRLFEVSKGRPFAIESSGTATRVTFYVLEGGQLFTNGHTMLEGEYAQIVTGVSSFIGRINGRRPDTLGTSRTGNRLFVYERAVERQNQAQIA